MYNITKTYHMGGEKVLDNILHMIARINSFPIFDTVRREFDHAALLTRQFSAACNISRKP